MSARTTQGSAQKKAERKDTPVEPKAVSEIGVEKDTQ